MKNTYKANKSRPHLTPSPEEYARRIRRICNLARESWHMYIQKRSPHYYARTITFMSSIRIMRGDHIYHSSLPAMLGCFATLNPNKKS